MRERAFYEAINRRLPKSIHTQSLTPLSMYMGGTPDRWYEGKKRDLYVEFKVLGSIPRSEIIKGTYTAAQIRWMSRRWAKRGDIIGLVGLPNMTAAIQLGPREWEEGTPLSDARSFDEVAHWIIDFCGD